MTYNQTMQRLIELQKQKKALDKTINILTQLGEDISSHKKQEVEIKMEIRVLAGTDNEQEIGSYIKTYHT